MEDSNFIIDSMTWSFSRINSFSDGCRKEWKEIYIDCEDKMDSFYGQFGTFCHQILERFFKGELTEWDLASYYEKHYAEVVTIAPPPKTGDTCYEKGLHYFDNFSFDLSKYEILGVEKKVEFMIDKYKCVGYIDCLLRDKQTGEITILDHKSSTIKVLKNGNISKSDLEHFRAFMRQLYLYSIPVLQEYGRVDYLKWNMFKDGTEIIRGFDVEAFASAEQWAYNTIISIERESEFPANPDFFYCVNLCSRRHEYCPYRRLGMIWNRINKEVCDDWKDKERFFNWALNNGYSDDLVLKRENEIDLYNANNCYWDYPEVIDGEV